MYKANVFGKEIIITNKEYESLLQRFDTKRAKASGCESVIRKACVLCTNYKCTERNWLHIDRPVCPIGAAFGEHGCYTIIGKLMRKVGTRSSLRVGYMAVYYRTPKSKAQVQLIYDSIKSGFKKVEHKSIRKGEKK